MASKNDITGDSLTSKASTKAYDDGWDRIFGKKNDADLGLVGDTREELPSAADDAADVMGKYAHPAYTRYPHLKDLEKALDELNDEINGKKDDDGI